MDTRSWAIGIDVGGTKIAGGVVDLASGEIVTREVVPTEPGRGGDAVLETALSLASRLADAARSDGREIAGVGVGVAELIDPAGRAQSFHTIDWRDLPVAERFAEIAPAVVESDVRAAGLAESRYGAGREFSLFAYVTVGTGISSCIVLHGKPFSGARGNALVLTSGTVSVPCPTCGALIQHVVEEYASGPALASRYQERTGLPARGAEEVLLAATVGNDQDARAVVESGAESLGSSIGFLVNVVDPEAIIIGGGLGTAPGPYWERLVQSTRDHIWADETRELPILQASLGPDAGLIGAAAGVTRLVI